MNYFFTSKLGETRYELADGSLLCKDVPIARTGTQIYHFSELPDHLEPNDEGYITVIREESEVFKPETMASFEGLTFTVLHPDEAVNPSNWKELSKGHVQNVRRGEGEQSDLLVADIIIKDVGAIKEVYNDVDEISCGYDADYISLGKGRAKQLNIIGNHVALVPNGRAGKRCSIGDNAMKDKQGWASKLWAAFKTNDAEGLSNAINEAEQERVKDTDIQPITPLAPVTDNMPKSMDELKQIIQDSVAEALKNATSDSDKKDTEDDEEENKKGITGDSAYTPDSLSRAELIIAGINLPKMMKDSEFKREVINIASKTVDGAKLLEPFLKGRDVSKLDNQTVDMVFTSASEIKKHSQKAQVKDYQPNQASQIKSLQEQIDQHWNKGKQ